MIVNLTYCNASSGKTIDFDYDDSAHTISNVIAEAPCSPGLLANTIIYSHVVSTTLWQVRVINTSTYARVTSQAIPQCGVGINSVVVTPSTTDVSSDGIINITATVNGTVDYSINDGQSYLSSSIFNGLAPGIYNVRVRNLFNGVYCYATRVATVTHSAIAVCDLVLGNVDVTPGPGGTITVQSYTSNHLDQPVQYRLDAGAWQDSPAFTGLAAGTYSVQIRYKNFTSCTASRNVTLSSCNAVITGVDIIHEQAKFANNGIITILATSSNGPIQYSKDDGSNYQSSNIFYNLPPATYRVRIKDAINCQAFADVIVKRYKAPLAEYPVANSNRVVITSGPPQDLGIQNLDNTLMENLRIVGKTVCRFYQPFSLTDLVRTQWRSSYGSHLVQVYDTTNVLKATLIAVKKTAYLNKSEALSANFSNYGSGKTQVWFPNGLASFFEIGQLITVSGVTSLNGSYTCQDIAAGTGTALGNIALIITANYTSGTDPLTGTVTVVYDIEDFDIWEISMDWSTLAAGRYYIKWTGTDDQFSTYTAQSEPVETLADVSELILIRYSNADNGFKIDSSTGIQHLLRVEGELLPSDPGGQSEVMEDSRRRVVKLREYVARINEFAAYDQPFYVLEKLRVAMAHDTIIVNDKEYQPTDQMRIEYPSEMELVGIARVKLRDNNFLAENSDDAGDVDGVVLDLDQGEIMGLDV